MAETPGVSLGSVQVNFIGRLSVSKGSLISLWTTFWMNSLDRSCGSLTTLSSLVWTAPAATPAFL